MAATATASPVGASVTPQKLAKYLGRDQGPEFFFQQAWVPLQTVQIPKNINLNRPLDKITIRLDIRITVANADMATVYPEALQSLIQQVYLQGTHNVYGALVPLQLTGADIFAWPSLFRSVGCSIIINGVRVTPLGFPNGLPLATFGAVGTYDCQIFWDIPLVPVLPASSKLNAVPFLFLQQNWGDTLNLQLIFGDATSLGVNGAGGTITFSALGSNQGNPQFFVYTNYQILGELANMLTTAVTVRAIQQVPQGNITANSANAVKLAQLQKYKTLNVVLKSGTLAPNTSPGVQVYATLSDYIFEQTQIVVDNKKIRNNLSNITTKEDLRFKFESTNQPAGYLPFSFIDSMNPKTAFAGNKVSAGSTYEVDSQIINGQATNYAEVIQEYFQGTPSGSEAD
jgi:hypothetical protein